MALLEVDQGMSALGAINFAAKMIREGEYPGTAIKIAASYFGVEYGVVQRGLASRAGKSRKGKKQAPKPEIMCMSCIERIATWRLHIRDGYAEISSRYLCDRCYNCPAIASGFQSSQAGVTHKWTRYKANVTAEAK